MCKKVKSDEVITHILTALFYAVLTSDFAIRISYLRAIFRIALFVNLGIEV
jgi:hypothetical protein